MKRLITALAVGTICSAVFGGSQPNAALIKVIQQQANEIKALKAEIKALKNGNQTSSSPKQASSADLQKVTALKNKISNIDSEIKKCQYKIRNVKYRILKMTDDDRKGWYYRKTGNSNNLSPMSNLPSNWNRKTVRIVYITKEEKRQKLEEELKKDLTKLEKEKQDLTKELASIN